MTYAEKLLDPRWRTRRLALIEQRGCKCEDCGRKPEPDEEPYESSGPLQVHHLIYLKGREPWEYESDLLVCVCDQCHANRQAEEDELKLELARLCGRMSIDVIRCLMKRIRAMHEVRGKIYSPLVFMEGEEFSRKYIQKEPRRLIDAGELSEEFWRRVMGRAKPKGLG